jgi:indole-3-glycerol phosphate synthase
MTPLVEVHAADELDRALALDPLLVGVNARNLKTLEVDLDVFGRLAPLIPDDRVKVAESGIFGPRDVERFVGEGAQVVLVGEALVREAGSGGPREAVRRMTGITR